MKRTLIIAPKYPVQQNDGASMRTMNFVQYFRGLGEVDILCRKGDTTANVIEYFRKQFFVDSTNLEDNAGCFTRIIDKVVKLKTWSTSHCTKEYVAAVTKIVIDGKYDYVLCRYSSQAYPLLQLNSSVLNSVILDVDDITTDSIYDADTSDISGIKGLTKNVDKYVLKKYHKRCMSFGSILYCSDADRLKTATAPILAKTYVVPNVYPGMAVPAEYPYDGHCYSNKLLFVGSLKYLPNFQGLCWFIKELFPKALEEFPDLTLSVVGNNPPQDLVDLIRSHPEIELFTDVPDVVPFYARCGVSVVPLLAGGGTRIKILESGFAKRPVLSTEIGAYGLGMTDGKEVMIFNDSQSFVNKYREIREDKESYLAMADRLSGFVRINFSEDTFRQAMDAVVKRMM
jgi:glycosyltransferase involved in cell wall biosynthesis